MLLNLGGYQQLRAFKGLEALEGRSAIQIVRPVERVCLPVGVQQAQACEEPKQRAPRVRRRGARSRADAVTVADAGVLLGCGPKKVRSLVKAKKLHWAPSFGNGKWITRASVEALLAGPVPEGRVRRPSRREVDSPKPPSRKPVTVEDLRAAAARTIRAGSSRRAGEAEESSPPRAGAGAEKRLSSRQKASARLRRQSS